ncbi:MAG: DUF1778 domain-containing protein [Kiloniellaceae bacterium]
MLPIKDGTEALGEPKSARMEQRTKPHVKATIEQAAALMGVDATSFVTNAAYERAQETISAHERTVLSAEDRDVFLAALENPSAPTEALRAALRSHDARVVSDE